MGSEEVPSGVLTLAESGIAPQAGAPPLEGYDLGFEPTKEDCLLVIDLQVDFMPGGALEVPGGTEVFPLVNAMIEKFERVVMSQDWHPPAHSSFASQHEGKAPYDVTSMPYGKQTLWPDHCVQGTSGCVTRVGFFQPHRARLPRLYNPARPLRPSFHVRVSLDPTSHVAPRSPARLPRSTRDVLPSTVKTPFGCRRHTFDVASVPGASTVSRLARVSTPSDSPIILDTRPSPTAPDFTRTSPFPSVRW